MSAKQRVRLGLVGCGKRGIAVTSLFKQHPGCQITALMDRFRPVALKAKEELGVIDVSVYDNFEEFLNKASIDAVFVACDPTIQVDLACKAMLAGKHVCSEVPVAFTLEDCWKLVKTVEKTGVKYQAMEQTRYWGFVDVWKQMHQRGEFGHICMVQGEYFHFLTDRGNWTDIETGELINDIEKPANRRVEETWRYKCFSDPIYYLPHTLSPLLKILDDRVVRVSCMGTRPHSYTFPDKKVPWRDMEYALMHTAKDTVMLVGAGFSMPHVSRGMTWCHWYELRGVNGSASSPRYKSDSFRFWRRGMESYDEMNLSTVPVDADAAQAESGHGGADFKPVDTFIRSILDDTSSPMDVYLSVETAAPAIVAAESARKKGILLEVPNFRSDKNLS